MRILKMRYGRTHIITDETDVFKGIQRVWLACSGAHAAVEVNPVNQHRFDIRDGLTENVGCWQCREALGLNPRWD